MKHKHRWTFEGLSREGNVVFPKTHIILDARPSVEFGLDGIARYAPVYFLETRQQLPNMHEMGTKTGILKLWDGAGGVLESWTLENVHLTVTAGGSSPDGTCWHNWLVQYGKAMFNAELQIESLHKPPPKLTKTHDMKCERFEDGSYEITIEPKPVNYTSWSVPLIRKMYPKI